MKTEATNPPDPRAALNLAEAALGREAAHKARALLDHALQTTEPKDLDAAYSLIANRIVTLALEANPEQLLKAAARLIVAEVQLYCPVAGDVVVVKLGDRAAGWIPPPEHETRMLGMLHHLWGESVPLHAVNFLVTHAMTEVSVVRAPPREPEAFSALRGPDGSIKAVADKTFSMEQVRALLTAWLADTFKLPEGDIVLNQEDNITSATFRSKETTYVVRAWLVSEREARLGLYTKFSDSEKLGPFLEGRFSEATWRDIVACVMRFEMQVRPVGVPHG